VLTEGARSPHEVFFYHKTTALQAVRSGAWKLHVAKGKPVALYNLQQDIGEEINVMKSNPAVTRKLMAAIRAFNQDLASNSRPAGFVDNPKPLSIKAQP